MAAKNRFGGRRAASVHGLIRILYPRGKFPIGVRVAMVHEFSGDTAFHKIGDASPATAGGAIPSSSHNPA